MVASGPHTAVTSVLLLTITEQIWSVHYFLKSNKVKIEEIDLASVPLCNQMQYLLCSGRLWFCQTNDGCDGSSCYFISLIVTKRKVNHTYEQNCVWVTFF